MIITIAQEMALVLTGSTTSPLWSIDVHTPQIILIFSQRTVKVSSITLIQSESPSQKSEAQRGQVTYLGSHSKDWNLGASESRASL